ncbi:helix-turn-helix domain-containing protein [Cyclobacterium xiamenense]|uniref:AraC family transcriptional regulator n=1 Tax=Cyclobacterium xiamenense TaxID=1297121 RepID=UPI0035D08943
MMRNEIFNEKNVGEISLREGGKRTHLFPLRKNQLSKMVLGKSRKPTGEVCGYSGDQFKLVYIQCKNTEIAGVSEGFDKESFFSTFALKGQATIGTKNYSRVIFSGFHNITFDKRWTKTVLSQEKFESLTVVMSQDLVFRFKDELVSIGPDNPFNNLGDIFHPQLINWQLKEVVRQIKKIINSNSICENYLNLKIKELLFLQLSGTKFSKGQTIQLVDEIGTIDKIIDYIESNFLYIPSLSTFYEEFSCIYTPQILNKILKSYLGITIKALLTKTKMQYAWEQLSNGAMNVNELSYSLHYSSPNHFSRAFKSWFGYTPQQVKKVGWV